MIRYFFKDGKVFVPYSQKLIRGTKYRPGRWLPGFRELISDTQTAGFLLSSQAIQKLADRAGHRPVFRSSLGALLEAKARFGDNSKSH